MADLSAQKKRRVLAVVVAQAAGIFLSTSQLTLAATAAFVVAKNDFAADEERKRKLELDNLPYMKNNYGRFFGRPQEPIEYRDRYGALTRDPNRNYSQKLTHFYQWELSMLNALLKESIEAPRESPWRKQPSKKYKTGRKPKYDTQNRLLFLLEWLAAPVSNDRQEFENCYAKSSCQEDKKHILKAINEVLKDEVKWPTAEERQEHYQTYHGIFTGVVGVLDIWEHYYKKSKDPDEERRTFSGKANTNTKKTIGIINKKGYFIYYKTNLDGRPNDRETWTNSELYMDAGKYFSDGERVAADGGFQGDGPQVISFSKVDDEDKALYNVAFKEVRIGIENAFGRVQMWFPILGVNLAYWKHDAELLELAVGAAIKLHNWMLRHRELEYDAQNNPRNWYRDMY